jgi:hypothetical protein
MAASARTLTVGAVPRPPAHARRGLPGWVWGAVLALALVGVAAAWSRSNLRPIPRSLTEAVAALRPGPAPRPAPEAARYVVASTVEPAHAALWLDGLPLPSGALNTTFLKDGHAHELRVVAPGYAPAVVVFADTPPPRLIRLEALPEPAAPAPVESALPAENALPAVDTAFGPSDEVERAAKAPRANARRAQRARRLERGAKAPSIQKIDATTPAIRVIP